MRGTPPPSYDNQVQRLGIPQPAVTSKAMKETSQKFVEQTRNMFNANANVNAAAVAATTAGPAGRAGSGDYRGAMSRPGTRGNNDMPRAMSPAPPRSVSPRPGMGAARGGHGLPRRTPTRAAATVARHRRRRWAEEPAQGSDQGYYRQASPNDISRAASPSPYRSDYAPRPASQNDMAMQLAPVPDDSSPGGYGSQRGRGGRPDTSSNSRAMSFYDGAGPMQPAAARTHSKSVADPSRQYARDGRPVIHFGKPASHPSSRLYPPFLFDHADG